MNDNIETSNVSIQQLQKQEEAFKLPKIERAPSRGPQKESTTNVKLPNIKIDPIELKRQEEKSERLLSTQEDFVMSIERKIKLVIEEQHIKQMEENDQSDEDAFEKKIIQNKEIIKKVKRKNEKLRKQHAQANNLKMQLNLARKLSQPNKEKRIRQYKQASIQNIPDPKKKDLMMIDFTKHKDSSQLKQIRLMKGVLKEFVSNKEINVRDVKSKQDLTPLNKVLQNNKPGINSVGEPRKLNKQLSHKILTPLQKNEQLFDAIHNYLQNPKRNDVDPTQPLKMGKDKLQLQKKLRRCQQKINASACEVNQIKRQASDEEVNKSEIKMVTSSQWTKVGLNNRGFFAQENSSFDKQIDRINRYLQRNQQSLERYVQNQKALVDVNLICRKHSNR